MASPAVRPDLDFPDQQIFQFPNPFCNPCGHRRLTHPAAEAVIAVRLLHKLF